MNLTDKHIYKYKEKSNKRISKQKSPSKQFINKKIKQIKARMFELEKYIND